MEDNQTLVVKPEQLKESVDEIDGTDQEGISSTNEPAEQNNHTTSTTNESSSSSSVELPNPNIQSHPLITPIDERWWIKLIQWPPFPPTGSKTRLVPIIMQNTNGPCSLLALSNILLLRGHIKLNGPPYPSSISFDSLSSILANYLVQRHLPPDHLTLALSLIPATRTGLDLNPCFASVDGFKSGSELSQTGFKLFEAAGITLVHGWIADAQDTHTWDVVVGKCGDYDQALETVVIGQELLESKPDPVLRTEDEQKQVDEALIVRSFLESTQTQLSYSGLFQLASGLAPDSLAALLRNSHLSVLYRRPVLPKPKPLPPPPDQIDPNYCHQTMLEVHAIAQDLAHLDLGLQAVTPESQDEDGSDLPKLFTLLTDMSFLEEDSLVWESLEDVEGGLSEFYDWKLDKSQLRRSRSQQRQHKPIGSNPDHSSYGLNTDADLQLARQLQDEENRARPTTSTPQRTINPTPNSAPPLPSQLVRAPQESSHPRTKKLTAREKLKRRECLLM